MQNISFVGKVYNMKTETDKKGNVSRVNLRLAVRKKFVTDEEKKNNQYNTFVPFVAFGKTAELLDDHVNDGDIIGFSNCEYSTFEYEKDGDKVYGHNFKVGSLDFIPGGKQSDDDDESDRRKSKSRKSSRRRDDDDDEEEEERPRRKKRPAREEKPPAKKKRRPVEEDYDDEDYDDDIDDDDVPF